MEENTDNYVICRICGKSYRMITKVHLRKHGWTKEQYVSCGFPVVSQYIRITYSKNLGNGTEEAKCRNIGNKHAVGSHDWSKTDKSNMKGNGGVGWPDDIQSPEMRTKRGQAIEKAWNKKTDLEMLQHASKSVRNSKKIKAVLGNAVYQFRSSWEFGFASYLYDAQVPFLFESLVIPYFIEGKKKRYIPDFYLPELNLICEIKPSTFISYKCNQVKAKACLDLGYNFTFVTEKILSLLPFWKAKVLIDYANQQPSVSNTLRLLVETKVQRPEVEESVTNKTSVGNVL